MPCTIVSRTGPDWRERAAFRSLIALALTIAAVWLAPALAQDTVPGLDESKIPDWVKRQATSPYKVVIENAPVKSKRDKPTDEASKPRTIAAPLKPAIPAQRAPRPAAREQAASGTAGIDAAKARTAAPTAMVPPPHVLPSGGLSIPSAPPIELPARAAETQTAAFESTPATTSMTASQAELRVIKQVVPRLPRGTLDALNGASKVVVAFTVNTDGTVAKPVVVSSSHRDLNRPSVLAISNWRFEPLTEPRDHRVEFTFNAE